MISSFVLKIFLALDIHFSGCSLLISILVIMWKGGFGRGFHFSIAKIPAIWLKISS